MAKRFAEFNTRFCVSCGACMNVCPKGAIEILRGLHAVVDKKICVGCGTCARTCPAGVIEVKTDEA